VVNNGKALAHKFPVKQNDELSSYAGQENKTYAQGFGQPKQMMQMAHNWRLKMNQHLNKKHEEKWLSPISQVRKYG